MRLVTDASNGTWLAGITIEDKVVDALAAAKAAQLLTEEDWISNRDILPWSPDQPIYLRPGAVVEVAVEQIGTLRNPVIGYASAGKEEAQGT